MTRSLFDFHLFDFAFPTPGGEVLLGILGGGVPPGSLNPDPYFRPKNVIFHTRFQTRPLKSIPFSDLAFKQKLCYYYLD